MPAKRGVTRAAGSPAPKRPRPPPPAAATAPPRPAGPQWYLLKTEPAEYSVDRLAAEPRMTGMWDGVRNHQARRVLLEMRAGEQGFLYHSSCKQPAIVGVVQVAREAYPDPTAGGDTPWVAVDVTLRRRLARPIPLEELKRSPDPAVQSLTLLRQARLSVHRLTEEQWHAVLALEGGPPA
eukprot:EG_transcript_27634